MAYTLATNTKLRDQIKSFFAQNTIGEYFTSVLSRDYRTFVGALKVYHQIYPAGTRPILLECDANVKNLEKETESIRVKEETVQVKEESVSVEQDNAEPATGKMIFR